MKSSYVAIPSTTTILILMLLFLQLTSLSPFSKAQLVCEIEFINLTPCVSYLIGVNNMPSTTCCEGVTTLVALVATNLKGKSKVCGCIKETTKSLQAKPENANSLQNKCGVNLCSKITPAFDCSK